MDTTFRRGAVRYGEFLEAISSYTTKVLEDVGDDQMKSIFTRCLNSHTDLQHPKTVKDKQIKKLRSALINATLSHVKSDIKETFDEQNIHEKFQLILDLQDRYNGRTTAAWRPPSDPEEHMKALRVAAKQEQLEKLQLIVSMKRRQVDHLKDLFKEKRASSDVMQAAAVLDNVKRELKRVQECHERFTISCDRGNEVVACNIDFDLN